MFKFYAHSYKPSQMGKSIIKSKKDDDIFSARSRVSKVSTGSRLKNNLASKSDELK